MDSYNQEPDFITDYYDYTMLPVQRLDGLGVTEQNKFGDKQYNLLKTLHTDIVSNPSKWTAMGYNIPNTLQAIEYLLGYWYTPNREIAIRIIQGQFSSLTQRIGIGAIDLSSFLNVPTDSSSTNKNAALTNAIASFATGNYTAGISNAASYIRSLFSKGDTRPGEREKDGWGKKQPNVPFKFKMWGDLWEFSDEWNEDRLSKGYWIKRNGVKWDVAKYVWREGDRLFKQSYLAPWEDKWTAGVIASWGQRHIPNSVQDVQTYGQGQEPQSRHMSGFGADLVQIDGLSPEDWIKRQQQGNLPLNPGSGSTESNNTIVYLGIGVLAALALSKYLQTRKEKQQ